MGRAVSRALRGARSRPIAYLSEPCTTRATAASSPRLKALLHDAALHGPDHANRDAVPDLRGHVRGRIAWVASVNPERGRRLLERFDAISW